MLGGASVFVCVPCWSKMTRYQRIKLQLEAKNTLDVMQISNSLTVLLEKFYEDAQVTSVTRRLFPPYG